FFDARVIQNIFGQYSCISSCCLVLVVTKKIKNLPADSQVKIIHSSVGIGVFKAMAYTLTVYLHLIAACSAIGVILVSDLKLSAYFFNSNSENKPPDIHHEIKIVIASLAVLWATGLLLVWQGIAVSPEYFHNQKLQAKIILVIILTINA